MGGGDDGQQRHFVLAGAYCPSLGPIDVIPGLLLSAAMIEAVDIQASPHLFIERMIEAVITYPPQELFAEGQIVLLRGD
ncbi:hypothetical protein D3C85_803360 [compost metagenome]